MFKKAALIGQLNLLLKYNKMKRIIFIFIFITTNNIAFAQNIQILDSITKEKLPFVIIKSKNINFYSDENGVFDKYKVKYNDSINLYFLGYKPKKLSYKQISDTILLIPTTNKLEEIYITKRNSEIIDYLKPSKMINTIISWPKEEIMISLTPRIKLTKTIKKISFKIKNSTEISKKDTIKAIIRLNVYKLNYNDSLFGIYSSEPKTIIFTKKDKKPMSFDFDNLNIKFQNTKSILFGIEVIDIHSSNKDIIDKAIGFQLTNKENTMFNKKLLIKSVFETKEITPNFYKKKAKNKRYLNFRMILE